MSVLHLRRVDGLLTVQDMGRPGHLASGLSRGGAMDRLALIEAAALLGANAPLAAIEMAGAGGIFETDQPMRIALTGAPMTATLDDAPLRWHASHLILPGQSLRIGGVQAGSYGYLTPAGGMATEEWLGSRSAHLSIGILAPLSPCNLPVGDDPEPDRPSQLIEPVRRFNGGTIRVIDGPQTGLFGDEVLAGFHETTFIRSDRGNRQGVRFDAERNFTSDLAAGLASDLIGPGDLQMTGDGVPFVLMAECQTIGGYPRIGTVIPADLPIAAQAAPGAKLRFQRLPLDEADRLWQTETRQIQTAAAACRPLVRDPALMPDLLAYQLIGGVTAGRELEDQ
ncbi:biotin-dependent carboxyltransferase family protein [Paracoccus onubensis]|uniref:5-oxoprolinase subunit C family protein n=1 Tax=Paracoccus onubensis TaxID=1675788 RepID=UPI002731F2C3|nr:biotin-dependent carboxyltransferase family protein [Paracoccus onubensis]MDP0928140.1 biotin-dependent carboxyltransferase family protein [Paracoccus onubensis]